jgi:hypothetical protein
LLEEKVEQRFSCRRQSALQQRQQGRRLGGQVRFAGRARQHRKADTRQIVAGMARAWGSGLFSAQ